MIKNYKEFEAFLFTLYRGKEIPERLQPSLTKQLIYAKHNKQANL
ncbi:uncharacterized protein METZ01_LOCUS160478 [marine metagenome]|uniref:Uncharacterized protein n=1 Tax=marine metagenome TaxID=408172 RepID=A0A382B205_9ZZZZ